MKKTFLLALTAIFSLGLFLTFGQHEKINAQTSNVTITSNVQNLYLPTELVKGQELPMYEYKGEVIPDFRMYFKIMDGRDTILDMEAINPETGEVGIDKGGYSWDFRAFSVDRLGTSRLAITYGDKTERILFTVLETDEEAPHIFMYDAD